MFKPMLAGTLPMLPGNKEWDLRTVKFPVLLSPKLDGVRAMVQNGQVYGRSLKLIPSRSAQEVFGREELNGLDGELVMGAPTDPSCFNKTVRAVCSEDGPVGAVFYVFDYFHEQANYRFRSKLAEESSSAPSCEHVVQSLVYNADGLYMVENEYLEKGYEGVMLRSVEGRYKQGRSTLNEGILLKLKRFADDEAMIIGFVEGQHNTNEAQTNELGRTFRSSAKAGQVLAGTLGKLTVRDMKTNVEFSIGTGWNEKTGKDIWGNRPSYLGKIVKYQHQLIGALNKPRIPSFKGMRDPVDIL